MSAAKVSLIVFLLLSVMSVSALAQDQPSNQKPRPVIWDENREPKDAVEEQIAAATKRGEVVLGSCLENCADVAGEMPAGFERGRPIDLPIPSYPPIARAAHASGTVEVKLLIDVDGTVIAAVAISGHPLLQATSVRAARSSTFTPTKWEGQPVKVTGVVKYDFIAGK